MLKDPQIVWDIGATMIGLVAVPVLARGYGLSAASLVLAAGEALIGAGGLFNNAPGTAAFGFVTAALILVGQFGLACARRAARKAGDMPEPSPLHLRSFRVIGAYAVPAEVTLEHAKKHCCPVPPLPEEAEANIRTCAHCGELCGVTEREVAEYLKVLSSGEPAGYVCHVCVVCMVAAGAITRD